VSPGAARAAAALAAALVAAGAPGPARADEVVRIAVTLGVAEVELAGRDLAAEPLRDGATRASVAGGKARVRLRGDRLELDGTAVDAAGLSFTAAGPIRHGGRDLSGEVEVRRGPQGLDVIDVLPLEDYVAAVTGAEMPPSFPPEALKAQSVAARTFALGKKLEAREQALDYDLGATVLSQVYPGAGGVDPRARAAAAATRGEVLVSERRPIMAAFHSACGGRTESGLDALSREEPYLRSVQCGRCDAAPGVRWKLVLSPKELGEVAGLKGAATGARVVQWSASRRALRVEVQVGAEKVTLNGADLRRRLGYERLPSLAFTVERTRKGFVLSGQGKGHGAGLCQWGAAGRARRGEGYAAILARYYPGTELLRMY
jgi:stage II sporulation protein D